MHVTRLNVECQDAQNGFNLSFEDTWLYILCTATISRTSLTPTNHTLPTPQISEIQTTGTAVPYDSYLVALHIIIVRTNLHKVVLRHTPECDISFPHGVGVALLASGEFRAWCRSKPGRKTRIGWHMAAVNVILRGRSEV